METENSTLPALAPANTNAYWEAVREYVKVDRFYGGPCVDTYGAIERNFEIRVDRFELCSEFSWTVTDPITVDFVRRHAGQSVNDPLAGSGWWAWLLEQAGIDVIASDINPPDGTPANKWHRGGTHVDIARMDAAEAVKLGGAPWTLLLSWPPYESEVGEHMLAAYTGRRVIYIGEGEDGCCGNDAMFTVLERDWHEIATHRPVQFYGLHDYVTVYERNEGILCSRD